MQIRRRRPLAMFPPEENRHMYARVKGVSLRHSKTMRKDMPSKGRWYT